MKFEESVGGVVVNGDKFLLLKYTQAHWGFVKGHIEPGETKEETLRRELEEETGITDAVIITEFKEEIGYYFKNTSKKVTFFLIKTNINEIALSSDEHVDYAWLTFDKALERLSFENTKRLLMKAKTFLS